MMLLTKNGITVDVIHPADIRRYKGLGYVESESPKPAEEPKDEAEKSASRPRGGSRSTPKPKDGEA
jgi:hypothetical protein